MRYPDGHVGWLATGHAVVRAVLADRRFSNRNELRHWPVPLPGGPRPASATLAGMFSRMDPPEHTRYRRMLAGYFTARKMAALRGYVENVVAEHLDRIAERGSPADLVPEFALPVPSVVVCELLGVPYADRELFQRNTSVLFELGATGPRSSLAWAALFDYLGGLVRSRRADPGDDLISALTGTDLSDHELAVVGVTLLVAGHETTANALSLGVFSLLCRPEWAAGLGEPDSVDGVVEELLRHQTIVHIGPTRAALEDVEIAGEVIRAGEVVTLSLPAANRDPAQFADPDAFDSTRQGNAHLAFGYGVHQCLGQHLARVELRVAFPALFNRFRGLRLAVPPEQVRTRADMGIYGLHGLPVKWDADLGGRPDPAGRSTRVASADGVR